MRYDPVVVEHGGAKIEVVGPVVMVGNDRLDMLNTLAISSLLRWMHHRGWPDDKREAVLEPLVQALKSERLRHV